MLSMPKEIPILHTISLTNKEAQVSKVNSSFQEEIWQRYKEA